MPITSTILHVAHEDPGRPAIVGAGDMLTYSGLVADSRSMFAVVDALHRSQAAPPEPAPETHGIPITATSLDSAFHTSRIMAGLAGYRAVSATIDPHWPLAHRVRVIVTCGIGVVIADDPELAEALAAQGWTGTVITFEDFRRREAAVHGESSAASAGIGDDLASVKTPGETGDRAFPEPADPEKLHLAPPPAVRPGEEPFLMLFSSGTTSDPKAFLKTRAQYRANVTLSSAHLEPRPGVATLAPGPVSYSLTLYALVECLATGGEAHMADRVDAIELGQRILAEDVTRIVAVPAIVAALTEAARRDPARFESLDLVVTGGANLPASIRQSLATVLPFTRLISYYGAAEIGFIGDSRDGDGTWISIYEGIEASICDERGAEVPDGELGTLWIRAAACSDGYLAGTTEAVLVGADGWATVHDQGRIVDGRLQLAGRAGDVIVTGGHKVSLPEVELAFAEIPGVSAVCAVALPDEKLGRIVALVLEAASPSNSSAEAAAGSSAQDPVPAGSGSAAEDTATPAASTSAPFPAKLELQAIARAHLAPQFVPRRWYRVDELPRTVGGKIRRPATTTLVESGEAERL